MDETETDKMLTCDLAFREFPGLMRGAFEVEKKLQVDGNGVKYRLGDFLVTFMKLSLGQLTAVKRLLIEVRREIAIACSSF